MNSVSRIALCFAIGNLIHFGRYDVASGFALLAILQALDWPSSFIRKRGSDV